MSCRLIEASNTKERGGSEEKGEEGQRRRGEIMRRRGEIMRRRVREGEIMRRRVRWCTARAHRVGVLMGA